MLYSLDSSITFSPYDMDIETTVEQALQYIHSDQLGKALICSLRLNEDGLVERVESLGGYAFID